MTKEWFVKYRCGPALVVDQFDNEDIMAAFCADAPEDIEQVLEIGHYPLSIADVTEHYVPELIPSKFDRESSHGDRIQSERMEGVI